jgi:hypothetical protein
VLDHDPHSAPAGIVALMNVSPPRREAFQNARRISAFQRPPALSSFVAMGRDAAVEKRVIQHAAQFPEREFPTDVLFLRASEPVRVALKIAEKQHDAGVNLRNEGIAPRGACRTARFKGKHDGALLSIGNGRLMCHG